jgi:putative transposase
MNVLAGCDFFTVEVLSWRGLVTYYVLFFLHLESRRVNIGGITQHPDREWMEQIGRTATQDTWGYLHSCRYVLHDHDTKFCAAFRSALASGGVTTIPLPARSPNLNAFAERWVRSVKQECLSKIILFGEGSLSRVLAEYGRHYHSERNHQGKGTSYHSPMWANNQIRSCTRLSVVSDLAVCSNTTGMPHDYFYQTTEHFQFKLFVRNPSRRSRT